MTGNTTIASLLTVPVGATIGMVELELSKKMQLTDYIERLCDGSETETMFRARVEAAKLKYPGIACKETETPDGVELDFGDNQ